MFNLQINNANFNLRKSQAKTFVKAKVYDFFKYNNLLYLHG